MDNTSKFTFKETRPYVSAYSKLFESTGWNQVYEADEKDLGIALSNSWYTISAYNAENELVGFGRVLSAGILYAFICDMIVAPEYQGQGIGSAILQKLIQKCKDEGIRVLWLFAAFGKSGFYKRYGFKERPTNAPGMQLTLKE
jgi:GNAT superfamily N-acetyltransferase